MKPVTYQDVELFEQSSERLHKTIDGEITSSPEVQEKREQTRMNFAITHSLDTVQDAFEKIRGTNDLMPITYLQKGLLVAKSVGVIVTDGRRAEGTGYLIAPGLIITNHHVIESAEAAAGWWFRTDYELDLQKQEKPSFFFKLRPDLTFFTSSTDYQASTENLDFTIIAVEQVSEFGNKQLDSYGYIPAFEASGKVSKEEYVSLVQHPNGELKKVAVRENKVIADTHPDFIYYQTDTDHGSSGSPVFNDDWVLVALHHRGVPTEHAQVARAAAEGEQEADNLILEANEGVRISSILKLLKQKDQALYTIISEASKKNSDNQLALSFESNRNPNPPEEPIRNSTLISTASTIINQSTHTVMKEDTASITIPLKITFSIGDSKAIISSEKIEEVITSSDDSFERASSSFPDYRNRRGYESGFLSGIDIKLEDLLQPHQQVLAPLKAPGSSGNKFILKYTHYSVAMHKKRKLCIVSAANINGKESVNLNRSTDKWITDSRMDDSFQTGPEVYKNNDLDRGHMVRRLDPVWGDLFEQANDDTFHYTNSCPQHKDLNQKTWLGLEDFVLSNTDTNNLRVSVFNGPVFSDDDIPYRGVLLPLQYFKIVAMVKKDGTPSITAYLLSQEDMLLEGFERVSREFVFGKYKTYQVSLKKIQQVTGLALDPYFEFDPLHGQEGLESTIREIVTGTEIKV